MRYLPNNVACVWQLRARGWNLGWLMSPAGYRRPVKAGELMPFALDNGLYHAPDQRPKGMAALVPFYAMLRRVAREGVEPLWVVVPDVPYDGVRSLAMSRKHARHVADHLPDAKLALAVQDGMTPDALDGFDAVFVAGSDEWKDSTIGLWCREGHARGMPVNVARVNTWRRAALCMEHGADTADGTCFGYRDRRQIEALLAVLYPSKSRAEHRDALRVICGAVPEPEGHLWQLT